MRIFVNLFLCLTLLFILCGCNRSKIYTKSGFYFDTVVTFSVYSGKNGAAVVDEALELCKNYEEMLSKTKENSDVWNLNNAWGRAVWVSRETIEILDISEYYRKLSGGRFDITVGAVSALWDFAGENPTLPPRTDIEKALRHVGSGVLTNKKNSVASLIDGEAQIDLGAIAKGYVADRIADMFTKNGVSGIIDLGGNIVLVGKNSSGKKWNVGLQNPLGENGDILLVCAVDGSMSVVTSGSYQRFFTENGKRYHHILDVQSGFPVDNGVASVTIFSELSTDGDVLSTAIFCLGVDEGLKMLATLENVAAVIVLDTGEVIYSSNINEMVDILQ